MDQYNHLSKWNLKSNKEGHLRVRWL